jgi:hypothetical protein
MLSQKWDRQSFPYDHYAFWRECPTDEYFGRYIEWLKALTQWAAWHLPPLKGISDAGRP